MSDSSETKGSRALLLVVGLILLLYGAAWLVSRPLMRLREQHKFVEGWLKGERPEGSLTPKILENPDTLSAALDLLITRHENRGDLFRELQKAAEERDDIKRRLLEVLPEIVRRPDEPASLLIRAIPHVPDHRLLVPDLERHLANENRKVVRVALERLRRLVEEDPERKTEVERALVRAIERTRDPAIALELVQRSGPDSLHPELLTELLEAARRSADVQTRLTAIQLLEAIGGMEARQRLRDFAADPSEIVRNQAKRAMDEIPIEEPD